MELFEELRPLLTQYGIELVLALLAAVSGTGWYARQSWMRKRLIDVVLNFVRAQMPVAEALKRENNGRIPPENARVLKENVIEKTWNEVEHTRKELRPALAKVDLEGEVEKAVMRVRRERQPKLNQPGGKGRRGHGF